jgi:ribonuclease R
MTTKENSGDTGGLKERIMRLLKQENHGMNAKAVMQKLKLPKNSRGAVKIILKKLSKEKVIFQQRRKFSAQSQDKTITGTVDIRNEFGFLVLPAGEGEDIFLNPRTAENLLPGDVIEVYPRASRSGGVEGDLKRIVKRTEAPVMCRVSKHGREVYGVLPFKENPQIMIINPSEKLENGDLILVKVTDKDGMLAGEVISHIYDKSDLGLYKQFILSRNEIRQVFPDSVMKEAGGIEIDTTNLGNRVDLRDRIIVTIDPKDAKDFDDAVSLEKKDGMYRLGVHIADVTHYMKEGSDLDAEAGMRGTSVYLPGSVVPMLPEKLSNDICSLRGGVDRMTFSVLMDVDLTGHVVSYRIQETIINNKRRFTYEEVEDILNGAPCQDEKIKETVMLMNELKGIMRKKFKAEGTIDFTLGEPVFVYGDDGAIIDIIRKETLESNKLIEYFMISANICAADFITNNAKQGMFRVHEKPAQRDIDDFNSYMKGLGLDVSMKKGTNQEFQRVLESIKELPKKYLIEKNLLRAMKLAQYSEKNLGHFGLGLEKYTHFTSPIRRYADVMVHRLIKHYSGVEVMKDTSKEYLRGVAGNISSCEERSEKAENDMFRLYALDFLKSRLGDEMKGVISRITKNGLIVELVEYPVEGFINFDSFMDDYYIYDKFRQTATGKRSKKIFRTGGEISVIINRVDLESLKLELEKA